ncbi:GPI-GlcNAc transferase complex, PIG-H component-domain-containing protein [Clohesyomyces aquaticus]|uniref:GPI-GlcNAc transferase complex, PIG-H component-domain-containing protein n=1 Tax=Clohesyomyces aquaticus TaxID=1231657 RepID=A0A1Y1ZEF1_9PLEO|nr:GPI-GlcNAc transferase complex, PIG-H component-domain-containing protein [Clohesyomyces aquaticus]
MSSVLQRITSPPSQALTTLQPTPSTISFTVSTRPVPKTLPALFFYYLSILTRLLAGTIAIVGVWTKWRLESGKPTDILAICLGGVAEAWLIKLAHSLPWRYLVPSAAVVILAVVRRGYTEESLLIIRSLGLQTSTSSSTYLTTSAKRFIPTTSIQDIFIHEAFKGFEVRFYLSIVVKGEEDVVVVFPSLLPRRQILEEVWRGARAGLWEVGGSAGVGLEKK